MSGIQNKITSHFTLKDTEIKESQSPKKDRQRSFSLPRINQGQKRDLAVRSPDPEVSINKMQRNDTTADSVKILQCDSNVSDSKNSKKKLRVNCKAMKVLK